MDLAIAKILKYVDDSKILGKIATEEDVFKLQNEVNSIYSWATLNNMSWNHLKFQLLRFGANHSLKDDTLLFSPEYQQVIDRKETVKDLGILVDDMLLYKSQKQKALSKTMAKIGWVTRTFKSRDKSLMRIL